MKKRRRRLPPLLEALKQPGHPRFDGHDQAFVEVAARRAFASFLRGILMEGDQEPRRTG